MGFTIMPDNFAPAFREIIYGYDDVGADAGEVEIMDPAGVTLGVKRFGVGRPLEVNISGYVRRRLGPSPAGPGECAFFTDPGRSTSAVVRIGGEVSPLRMFTAGIRPSEEFGLLSLLPRGRSLGTGEYDELSFAVPGCTLSAVVAIAGVAQPIIKTGEYVTDEGVVTLRVDASHIASAASGAGIPPDRCRRAGVTVYADSQPLARVWYSLGPTLSPAPRLAWLNSLGGVDYHTFAAVTGETVTCEKERITSAAGTRAVSSLSSRAIEAVGGYFPRALAEALGEIVCSPLVWRLDGRAAVTVDVLTGNAVLTGETLPCFRVSFTEQQVTSFQIF